MPDLAPAGTVSKFLIWICVPVAAAACHHHTPPTTTDPSVRVTERRERSVTDDPAVKGNVPANGWQVTDGDRTAPPPPDADDEVAEFAEKYKNTTAPKIVEAQLAPGSTRTVELQIAGPSGLSGAARWVGTGSALKVTLALGGSTLASGASYAVAVNRGGSFVHARTTGGGHAALVVTNTSSVPVRVRLILTAAPL